MPKFKVTVWEVYAKPVEIEAATKEEAIERVRQAEGDWDKFEDEFSHSILGGEKAEEITEE